MSDTMPNNGKSYTQVLLDVYEKIDNVEQRVVGKVDAIIRDNADFKAALAKGDAKFKATDDKIAVCYETLTKDIDENTREIGKVRNLNLTITTAFSAIAAFVGWNQ